MTSTFFILQASAENKEQAYLILDTLLRSKLVTGGQIIGAPARFLWKGKIVDMEYYTITSYTVGQNKNDIVAAVKKVSIEEVPMITFTAFDGNEELLRWIEETIIV